MSTRLMNTAAFVFIVVMLLIGFNTVQQLAGPSAAAEKTATPPATVDWKPIPAGEYTVTVRTPIIVRETDQRGAAPVAFYYVRWMEVGDKLTFGKDAVITGANRDGWMPSAETTIEAAQIEAMNLALNDLSSTTFGLSAAWLQLECPASQVPSAQASDIAVKDWDPTEKDNWFIRITPGHPLPEQYLKVCEGGKDVPVPTPGAEPTPGQPEGCPEGYTCTKDAPPADGGGCTTNCSGQPQPTATPPTQPAPSGCSGVSTPVRPGQVAPKGSIVVWEKVDYSRGTVEVTAKVLDVDTVAGAQADNPLIHINMWTGFCTLPPAQFDADGQVVERQREAGIPSSWANGYTVTRLP